MTAYHLEVDADNETKHFDLKATNRAAAVAEAEYVMHMFPLRLYRREGYLRADGRMIKSFYEAAADR